MPSPKLRNRGLWTARFERNPEELRFAAAWDKHCVLDHLLGDGHIPASPTDREREVAATVIQWLGSPVGQAFLSDLGYGRADDITRSVERRERTAYRHQRELIREGFAGESDFEEDA